MIKTRIIIKLVLMALLLSIFSAGAGCISVPDFDRQLRAITRPYWFNIVTWELDALGEALIKTLFERRDETIVEASKVSEYFATVERIQGIESEIESIRTGNRQGDLASLETKLNRLQQQNAVLASIVEHTIERQIRGALTSEGIHNPVDKYIRLKAGFPPVNFILGNPPYLLVVSPRDKIESIREIALLPDIGLTDMESIEEQVDKLGVSSLVVAVGGLSTYPSFVTGKADLRFTINTVAEEWLHQYLVFKPLGFRYLLDIAGICRNYEIATMNETLAGIVSREIGEIIYEEHYAPDETDGTSEPTAEPEFDFNKEMREIRRAVDSYLVRGEIDMAEEFMERKRLYLATKGYHIRKLNQAYFAFHGTYADKPTSISPIGAEMKQLRGQSASLKEFLEVAASMTSRQDLAQSVR